jgi:hypothetical protein
MATDVYGRQDDILAGVMSADMVSVSFAAVPGTGGGTGGQDLAEAGMLMQALQLQYSQQFTMLFELNSAKVFYVTGRPSGQAVANRIVGVKAIQRAFYNRFGNVCNARGNTMRFASKAGAICDDGDGTPGASPALDYTTKYNVLTSLSISVESQRMLIGENLTLAFGSMSAPNDA